jgi:hypothetical protein
MKEMKSRFESFNIGEWRRSFRIKEYLEVYPETTLTTSNVNLKPIRAISGMSRRDSASRYLSPPLIYSIDLLILLFLRVNYF